MYITARKKDNSFKKIAEEKKSFDEIVQLDEKISLDVADVIDHYEKIKTAYNRIYYISDGKMQININNQEIILEKGDACFVEKGMVVELKGTFTAIIVSRPTLSL